MGNKLEKGCNDLQTKYPNIASEWDFEENFPIRPSDVTYSCNHKYNWICPRGHSYEASPNSRTNKKSGCKYCANKAVLIGFNDLPTTHPEIAKEWDYFLNGDARPEDYTAGSDKEFYWICPRGHKSYKAPIKQRKAGRGCRICGYEHNGDKKRKTIIKKEGSFLDNYPDIASEWDYESNRKEPQEYTAHSNVKVMWICSWCHQRWPAKINARVSEGSGCPFCNNKSKTSFPEQAVLYYIKKIFPDAIGNYKEIFDNKMSLDIYIPSLSTAIEYDGVHWHDAIRNANDKIKFDYCKRNKIRLIRIRECELENASTYCDVMLVRKDYNSNESLDGIIQTLISCLSTVVLDVNCNRDKGTIKNLYISSLQENSLQSKFPEFAKEWNYLRNGDLTPDKVSAGSAEEVWWSCSICGYEYKKRVYERTTRNAGCKKCSSRKKAELKRTENLIIGVTDLKTLRPDLLQEWDFKKNVNISPENYTCGSHEEVWWICKKCGKSWKASIYCRTSGHSCKDCGRIQAGLKQKEGSIKKYGSLAESFPEIAIQWDYNLNDELPEMFSPIDRSKKFHWKCKCGKEWQSDIFNLTHSKYVGCSSCRHKKLYPLTNSMKMKAAKKD